MPSKQLRKKGATPGGINIYTPCSFEPIGLSRVQSTGDWRHQTAAGRHRQSTRFKGLGETGSLCRLQSPMRSITTTGKRVRDLPITLDKLQQQRVK
jgi:hypothetical protein